jgi:hypothetical protein
VTNLVSDTISEVADDGTLLLNQVGGGGLQSPVFVAVDAGQNVWFSNFFSSFAELAGNGGSQAAGTPISPSAGAHAMGGYGLDAGLGEPNYIAPDRSGNIWTADQAKDTVVMFFGLATPTATPIRPVPIAP